jgi:hypothetical protein
MINRKILTEIIEKEGGINWWKPELFNKNILPLLPKELEIVALPPEEEANYNCFVFALGLENEPYFLGGNNPVQKEFIRYLLSEGVLAEATNELFTDNLVSYENKEGVITHAGIVQEGETILSKWMWGPTILHALWDVPSSFGDKVFYTNRPVAKEVRKVYEAYKASGVEIKPIS